MRIDKIKAWDIKSKRMIKPTLICIDKGTLSATIEEKSFGVWKSQYRFDEVIFLEYTGLKDINEKEIYEGDIVYVNSHKMIVKNGQHEADSEVLLKGIDYPIVFGYYVESPCGSWEINLGLALRSYNVSVVGNIYENKELL